MASKTKILQLGYCKENLATGIKAKNERFFGKKCFVRKYLVLFKNQIRLLYNITKSSSYLYFLILIIVNQHLRNLIWLYSIICTKKLNTFQAKKAIK